MTTSDTCYGMEIGPLGDGYTPIDALVLVRVMDNETGDILLCHRRTDGIRSWDALGMMELTRRDIGEQWRLAGEDD